MSLRVIVADDHPMVRDALRLAIAQALTADIVEAGTLDAVTAELRAGEPVDLVLLDLNMPGMQGFAGLAYLCASHPEVPVAVISANEEPQVIRRAIGAGASGYLPKSLPMAEMLQALRSLSEGEVWIPATIGPDDAVPDEDMVLTGRVASLTAQQVRVLMMLNDGLVNKQIAYELGVSEGTVKAHVSAILHKLGVASRTQAVILARRLTAEIDAPQAAIRRAAAGG